MLIDIFSNQYRYTLHIYSYYYLHVVLCAQFGLRGDRRHCPVFINKNLFGSGGEWVLIYKPTITLNFLQTEKMLCASIIII